MANYERKERFLNESYDDNEELKEKLMSAFSTAERTENRFKKDLAEFSRSEIEDLLVDFESASPVYLDRTRMMFGRYTDWCINNGYVDKRENDYYSFSFTDIGKYARNVGECSELDILEMCEDLENPMDKFLVAAPFFGFRKNNVYSDITTLKKENINKNAGTMIVDDRIITVPDWFINVTLDSFNTYKYVSPAKSINNNKIQEYNLAGSGVIKYRASNNFTGGNIHNLIWNKYCRLFSVIYGSKITYSDVFKSGYIYRAKRIILEYDIKDVKELWENQ